MHITDPRRLEFRDGRLRDGDFIIDIYYKRVLTSELLDQPDVARAYMVALSEGAKIYKEDSRAALRVLRTYMRADDRLLAEEFCRSAAGQAWHGQR